MRVQAINQITMSTGQNKEQSCKKKRSFKMLPGCECCVTHLKPGTSFKSVFAGCL